MPRSIEPIPRAWYDRDTVTVAKELLGKALRTRDGNIWREGVIVEDEAYIEGDPANHAYRGMTGRNRSMFAGPGTAYVYALHQVFCMNVVTRKGEAVLIRALDPLGKLEGRTDGPGRLCRALGITRDRHDGRSLCGNLIQIVEREFPPFELGVSTRVGVSKARDKPLRFFVRGNPFVSRQEGKPARSLRLS